MQWFSRICNLSLRMVWVDWRIFDHLFSELNLIYAPRAGDRLTLWPKLIVNLTNPVRGGGDTSTKSISHPNQPCQRRSPGSHRLSLRSHRDDFDATLCQWVTVFESCCKGYMAIDSNTSKRGATSAQRLREYIGIQKFMSTSEIRHSHAVSQAVEVVSVYLHHRPSFWVNLPPVCGLPRLSHGIIRRTGERQANNIFF